MKNRFKLLMIIFLGFIYSCRTEKNFNILDFGAVRDGKTLNTAAIQKAIDECSKKGGRVVIPKGVYLSGTLYMKSNVELHIEEGAILKGSASFKDYPDNKVTYKNAFTHFEDGKLYANKAFIFAENVSNISFTGKGTINGSGDSPEFNLGNDDTSISRSRPCMLLIIDSKHIKLNDLTLENSAYWLQNYLGCEFLELKGLKIYNQSNYNQDGMDIDAKHVLVEGCTLDVDDDGICFKSHDPKRIVEDVVVRNCKISSNCNAIKFGTKSMAGLKNVSISNCNIQKASADPIRHWQKTLKFIDQPITVISGIALEAVDGGIIDSISIFNITMKDVQTPLFIVLGNRGNKPMGDKNFYNTSAGNTAQQAVGKISNIQLKNIKATSHSKMASSITAFPGHYIENITLDNIAFNIMGAGTQQEAITPLIENPGAYPENRMYGLAYPASGFFIRHVKNLSLNHIKLSVRKPDYRSSIILDDVLGVNISNVNLPVPEGNTAAIGLKNSKNIKVINPVFKSENQPLIQLDGTAEPEIAIAGFKKYKGWLTSL
ncbi:glycoside hydrolase family 28 [Pedobacter heparinus DSM 2366]|uniref:Glycoside hydrolase family 28 n=2 Tax=Pedobacter heparinus TaxID=984 RepID=C6XVU3_PEDHD|nr:glycoside hydrolase family 28 [Pedobacter heparinus DSM 2366]